MLNGIKYLDKGTIIYALLSILGLSFWFWLGFPFANHNESFGWVVQLGQMSFWDVLTQRISPVASWRPLGQAVAWLGYYLGGGKIYLVELFNYLIAAAAWIVLFLVSKEKRIFSFIALLVGGAFFSGYIYLFHLHGVFYSPLLLYVALLFYFADQELTEKNILVNFLLALVISLFHTFSLLVYMAFSVGLLYEERETITKKQFFIVTIFAFGALILLLLMSSAQALPFDYVHLSGLITSYRMIEIKMVLSVIALFLSIITVCSIGGNIFSKVFFVGVVVALSGLFFFLKLPLLIVWIITCLWKTTILKKCSLSAIIGITFLFPLFTGTGSPTYCVFVLMACAAVVPLGLENVDKRLAGLRGLSVVSLLLIVICILLVGGLRRGIQIPVISRLAQPILAEREKTFQLENIVDWMVQSEYNDYSLILSQAAANPAVANNAINRQHRPPTRQEYLDMYVACMQGQRWFEASCNKQLLVCFGDEEVADLRTVYQEDNKFAGKVFVYLLPEENG